MIVLFLSVLLGLTSAERDSILAETPGNEAFWLEQLEESHGEYGDLVEYLFTAIPRLDRLEMNQDALADHVNGALESRYVFYGDLPDSLFRECLVTYRIDQEPVAPYRAVLSDFWSDRLSPFSNPQETALGITAWIGDSLRVSTRDYLGGISDPVSVLETRAGTPRELRVLLCASLKSVGIAARPVLGWFAGENGGSKRWLEVWTGSQWIPLAAETDSIPEHWAGLALALIPDLGTPVTGDYTTTGVLTSLPLIDQTESEWTAVLNVSIEGMYLPLDYIWLDTTEPDTVELGIGIYTLMVSSRRPSGVVDMWLHQFSVTEMDTVMIDLNEAVYRLTQLP